MNGSQHQTRYDIHNTGPALTIVQGQRKMRCFMVTESELKQIGLANLLSTISSSIGAMLIGFGLDIYKDLTILSGDAPAGSRENASSIAVTFQNASFYLGVAFILAAGALLLWRRSLLAQIKAEKGDEPSGKE